MRVPGSTYFPRCFFAALQLIAALLVYTNALSQDHQQPWQLELSLATVYDNNALKYSDKYLDLFVNNEDPGRFHIKTSDDLTFNLTASLRRSLFFFGKYGSTLGVD